MFAGGVLTTRDNVLPGSPQTKTPRSDTIQAMMEAVIRITGRVHCLAYLHTKATVGAANGGGVPSLPIGKPRTLSYLVRPAVSRLCPPIQGRRHGATIGGTRTI